MSRKEEHHLRQWSSSPIGDQRNVSWGKKERPDKVSSNLMQVTIKARSVSPHILKDLITSYGMKDFSPSSKNDRMIEVMEGEPASDIGPMLSDASSSGPVKQKRLPARRRILNEVSTLNSLMDTQLSVLRDESIFDEGVQFVGDRALTTTITTTTKTPSTPVRRNSSLTANEQLLLAGVSTNIHRKRKRESQKGDIQMVQDIRPGSLHSAVNFKVDATSSSIIRETMQTLHVGSVQEGLDSASLKRKYLDKEEAPFHPMKSVLPLPLGNDQDDAQQFLTGQPRKRFCQKVPVRVGSSHLDGGTYTFKPPLPIAGQKPQSRKLIPQSPQLRSAHQDFSGSNGAHRDNVHSPTAYRTKSREVEASHTPFSVQIRENTSDVCEASPVHWNRTKNESPFWYYRLTEHEFRNFSWVESVKIRLSHWNKWYAIRKYLRDEFVTLITLDEYLEYAKVFFPSYYIVLILFPHCDVEFSLDRFDVELRDWVFESCYMILPDNMRSGLPKPNLPRSVKYVIESTPHAFITPTMPYGTFSSSNIQPTFDHIITQTTYPRLNISTVTGTPDMSLFTGSNFKPPSSSSRRTVHAV